MDGAGERTITPGEAARGARELSAGTAIKGDGGGHQRPDHLVAQLFGVGVLRRASRRHRAFAANIAQDAVEGCFDRVDPETAACTRR